MKGMIEEVVMAMECVLLSTCRFWRQFYLWWLKAFEMEGCAKRMWFSYKLGKEEMTTVEL